VTLVVANVFVDNETPADAAKQIVETAADVVIIVESTSDFMATFDQNGGTEAYPNRVVDPDVTSDYAIAVVTDRTLGPRSEFRSIGPLRVAIADIDVEGTNTLIVALNPMATVDDGGHETWKEQLEALTGFLPTLTGPVVVAGDLNSSRYRPEFEQILELGYTDAIDALGEGLSPSFKLTAGNEVGAVVRLDHALTSAGVHGVSMRNLGACGSDHLPFLLELAVRVSAGHHAATAGRPSKADADQ
jgi:endonuclease/exonuclease/phosphatase (EEP) superfamily protein YafD